MTNKKASLGDRYAEITVLLITFIALFSGWMVKSSVENRSIPFESQGVSAALPAGWLTSEGRDGSLVSAMDMTSSGFPTTYTLKYSEVAADVTYGLFASAETRILAESLQAFRVLDQQQVQVDGREAFEIKYVFVESNPNATHQEIPAVVRGVEYIFIKDGQAVAVTYWADESEFETGLGRFQKFLASVTF